MIKYLRRSFLSSSLFLFLSLLECWCSSFVFRAGSMYFIFSLTHSIYLSEARCSTRFLRQLLRVCVVIPSHFLCEQHYEHTANTGESKQKFTVLFVCKFRLSTPFDYRNKKNIYMCVFCIFFSCWFSTKKNPENNEYRSFNTWKINNSLEDYAKVFVQQNTVRMRNDTHEISFRHCHAISASNDSALP